MLEKERQITINRQINHNGAGISALCQPHQSSQNKEVIDVMRVTTHSFLHSHFNCNERDLNKQFDYNKILAEICEKLISLNSVVVVVLHLG